VRGLELLPRNQRPDEPSKMQNSSEFMLEAGVLEKFSCGSANQDRRWEKT
jgi:hypothetical protein